ncbi:hypothetical protein D3C87_755770 [compost metagenome]
MKDLALIKQQNNLNLFLQPKSEVATFPIENQILLTASKAELSEMASIIMEAADDGIADPLDTLIIAKKGLYVFESIVEGMKGKCKLPEKGYERHNVAMSERATGVQWHYDTCNDPEWNELNSQRILIEARLKVREAYLKSLNCSIKIESSVSEETGEAIEAHTIFPAVRVAGESLILSLK